MAASDMPCTRFVKDGLDSKKMQGKSVLIQSFEKSPHLKCLAGYTYIPVMASLWIGSGAGWPLKGLGLASPDHQVGAHFEALDKGVLMAASKSIETFLAISTFPELRCPYTIGARSKQLYPTTY